MGDRPKLPHAFKEGNKANPWGRKGKDGKGGKQSIRGVLKELMGAPPDKLELANVPPYIVIMLEEQLGRPPTRADIMAMVMLARATGGDLAAWTAVVDRVEGKPMQHTKNEHVAVSYEDFLKNTQIQIEEEENESAAQIQQGQKAQLGTSEED